MLFELFKPAIEFYKFAREIVAAAVANRLAKRARDSARKSQSALAFKIVHVQLESRLERWAAKEMEKAGRAAVCGDCIEIGVSMVSPAILHAMSMRGRF